MKYKAIKSQADILTGNEYTDRENGKLFELRDQVRKFMPCEILRAVESNTLHLFLDIENEITINRDYKGNFNVYSWKQYPNIDAYTVERAQQELTPAPNNFKVLSKKNLDNWIAYNKLINDIKNQKSIQNTERINAFMERIQELSKMKGNKLIMHSDKKSGYIENEYLSLKFEISRTGYISTETRLQFRQTSNIENYATMSALLIPA